MRHDLHPDASRLLSDLSESYANDQQTEHEWNAVHDQLSDDEFLQLLADTYARLGDIEDMAEDHSDAGEDVADNAYRAAQDMWMAIHDRAEQVADKIALSARENEPNYWAETA